MAKKARKLGRLARGLVFVTLSAFGVGCSGQSDGGSSAGGSAGEATAGQASGGTTSMPSGGKGGGGTGKAGASSMGGTSAGGSGGGSTRLGEADATMLFEQMPSCASMDIKAHFEGTIDGTALDDVRMPFQLNGGYVNGSNGHFDTPGVNAMVDPEKIGIHFGWTIGLAHGQAATTINGVAVPPETFPHAGEELCIDSGVVGWVQGGAEDGVFKFRLDGAHAGADCSGEAVALEIRGCMN